MNRLGKHQADVAAVDASLPMVARAAGEELHDDHEELKPKKPGVRSSDVATRLLQLMSLVVVFVFGIVGASLFTLRPTGLSHRHPALQHSTRLVVTKLQNLRDGPIHSTAVVEDDSGPIYLSLLALRLRGDAQRDAVEAIVTRFAPDLLVLQTKGKGDGQAQSATMSATLKETLPTHRSVSDGVEESWSSSVFFHKRTWRLDTHGVHAAADTTTTTTTACPWTISWVRLQRRESREVNETLTIATVHESAQDTKQTPTSCNPQATLADLVAHLPLRLQDAIILAGLPHSLDRSFVSTVNLVDPFTYLHLPVNLPASDKAIDSPRHVVAASERLRPVSATVVRPMTPRESVSFEFPLSVVYKLLPRPTTTNGTDTK